MKQDNNLIELIDSSLQKKGFGRLDLPVESSNVILLSAWKHRSKINSAIVVIQIPPDVVDVGLYAKGIKNDVGEMIGYRPFFDPIGLHLILVGRKIQPDPELVKSVDRMNTQKVILQTIHVVDLDRLKATSVRNWGTFISGGWVKEIEKIINQFLSGQLPDQLGILSEKNQGLIMNERYTILKARPPLLLIGSALLLLFVYLGILATIIFL